RSAASRRARDQRLQRIVRSRAGGRGGRARRRTRHRAPQRAPQPPRARDLRVRRRARGDRGVPARALRAGVARDAIAIDPGLEFGKEPATDLEILARFGELRALGYPIVLAASRKSFIGRVVGRPAAELLVPSLAAAAAGIAAGARIVRAHDVAETVQLARMLAAIERAGMPAEDGASNSCAAEAV